MYTKGQGVEQSDEKALAYARLACRNGDEKACQLAEELDKKGTTDM
jgi:TPR repeat protein